MPLRSGTIAGSSARVRALVLLALAWTASSCIKPRDDYEDFASRPLAQREAGIVDVQLTPCQDLLAQNPSGSYYVSCLPKDLPIPFALATTQKVTASEDGTTATLELSFTPLKTGAMLMSDTSGMPIPLPKTMIDSMCAYTLNIGTLTLGADANSLMRDLTATDVVLRGKLQSVERSCAELDGKVDLIMLSLLQDGDHCIFLRAPADGPIPAVPDYSCDPSGLHPRGSSF